jgi:hypothetical protein
MTIASYPRSNRQHPRRVQTSMLIAKPGPRVGPYQYRLLGHQALAVYQIAAAKVAAAYAEAVAQAQPILDFMAEAKAAADSMPEVEEDRLGRAVGDVLVLAHPFEGHLRDCEMVVTALVGTPERPAYLVRRYSWPTEDAPTYLIDAAYFYSN